VHLFGFCIKKYVLKDMRGNWELKQESFDCTLERTRFERRFINVAAETTERKDTVFVTFLFLEMCLHAN
jgi:hypothetical protein